MVKNPEFILKKYFGYDSFRGDQREIIDCLMNNQDVLVLMPTGGGKSLCYQIPSLLKSGTGIIISPLISLMKDQVDSLIESGVSADFLNSSMTYEEQINVEKKVMNQEIDLLYIAPERLNTPRFTNLLKNIEIALFAIDEAHCVSQWGHDFRPDYLNLTNLAEEFPKVPRIALTATADYIVRKEIVQKLKLGNAPCFIASFDRPNIFYRVVLKENSRNQLLHFIKKEHSSESGIVYCLSRNKVEKTADFLCKEGFNALPYHAGLNNEIRKKNQQRFLMEENIIIVATIAFGMGIDKPDVRFVAHLDMPKNLEAYYQETGRAGRDGKPANAWMAYSLSDVVNLRTMMDKSDGNEEYKLIQRKKLEAMLGFCEIIDCRRKALLHYFGEDMKVPCGYCDTCKDKIESFDATIPAQKALSCVYRTGERFGAKYLIDILLAKNNDRIISFGHDKISTFGIGEDLTHREWNSIFRQLVATNNLDVNMEKMGGFNLNKNSWKILKSEKQISFRIDPKTNVSKKKERKIRISPAKDSNSQDLFEILRAWRLTTAKEKEIPPFTVFHDSTLWNIVEMKPDTDKKLLAISGIGQTKLDHYGEALIKIIKEFET